RWHRSLEWAPWTDSSELEAATAWQAAVNPARAFPTVSVMLPSTPSPEPAAARPSRQPARPAWPKLGAWDGRFGPCAVPREPFWASTPSPDGSAARFRPG